MSEVHQLKTNETTSRPPPARIVRPCDFSLKNAITALENQVGTVEAYNKLCDAAAHLKKVIDDGQGKQAISMFATDPAFIFPVRG